MVYVIAGWYILFGFFSVVHAFREYFSNDEYIRIDRHDVYYFIMVLVFWPIYVYCTISDKLTESGGGFKNPFYKKNQ